jgi:hypothetical protein
MPGMMMSLKLTRTYYYYYHYTLSISRLYLLLFIPLLDQGNRKTLSYKGRQAALRTRESGLLGTAAQT